MTQVAADAGLTDTALHSYVRNKDEFIRLVFGGTSAHETSLVRTAADLDGPAEDVLLVTLGAALTRIGDQRVREDFLVELEAALAFARAADTAGAVAGDRHRLLLDHLEVLLAAVGHSPDGVTARGEAATLLAVIEGFWLLSLADDMQDALGEVPRTVLLMLRSLRFGNVP